MTRPRQASCSTRERGQSCSSRRDKHHVGSGIQSKLCPDRGERDHQLGNESRHFLDFCLLADKEADALPLFFEPDQGERALKSLRTQRDGRQQGPEDRLLPHNRGCPKDKGGPDLIFGMDRRTHALADPAQAIRLLPEGILVRLPEKLSEKSGRDPVTALIAGTKDLMPARFKVALEGVLTRTEDPGDAEIVLERPQAWVVSLIIFQKRFIGLSGLARRMFELMARAENSGRRILITRLMSCRLTRCRPRDWDCSATPPPRLSRRRRAISALSRIQSP